MTNWENQDTVITLDGYDGSSSLNEVQKFTIGKNEWKALPSLLEETDGSSAAVLNGMLYNLGGAGSTYSVSRLDLLSVKGKWKSVKTPGLSDFSGQI